MLASVFPFSVVLLNFTDLGSQTSHKYIFYYKSIISLVLYFILNLFLSMCTSYKRCTLGLTYTKIWKFLHNDDLYIQIAQQILLTDFSNIQVLHLSFTKLAYIHLWKKPLGLFLLPASHLWVLIWFWQLSHFNISFFVIWNMSCYFGPICRYYPYLFCKATLSWHCCQA